MIFLIQYNVNNFRWENFKNFKTVGKFEFQKTVKFKNMLIYSFVLILIEKSLEIEIGVNFVTK